MEEKERYELIGYCSYRDTETGVIGDNFVGVLNEQDQKIKELESKLAESRETIKNNSHNKWLKAEAERYKNEYQSLKGYVDQLKQQLAEKDQAIESLQEINQSLGQTCNNDAKEIERLREQFAEKDLKIIY